MASVVFLAFISSLFLLIIIITSGQFNSVESLPLSQGKRNVVYTRYVRRRPIPYSNNYVREVIEVFKTHRRPPPYAFLHDEDLTRFVRCDFDPSMADCDEETNPATTTQISTTSSTTSQSDISTSTSTPSTSSTTFAPLSWWDRRTEESSTETTKTTTTTTEQNFKQIPQLGLPEAITSTSKSLVSTDLEDEETNKSEDGNEYDDGINKETNNDPGETEYYDEGEEDENNNSQGATNDNEVEVGEEEAEAEVETADDADAEVETQTQEATAKPTTKSFLNWF